MHAYRSIIGPYLYEFSHFIPIRTRMLDGSFINVALLLFLLSVLHCYVHLVDVYCIPTCIVASSSIVSN